MSDKFKIVNLLRVCAMLTSKELQGTGEDPLQRVLSRSNIFEQEAAVPEPGWHQLQVRHPKGVGEFC